MTLQEFKAWFDGFTEGFNGKVPTQKQWKRINERVSEINGVSVERHYIERNWPYWTQVYTPASYSTTRTFVGASGGSRGGAGGSRGGAIGGAASALGCNTTTTAMYALGKAESKAA